MTSWFLDATVLSQNRSYWRCHKALRIFIVTGIFVYQNWKDSWLYSPQDEVYYHLLLAHAFMEMAILSLDYVVLNIGLHPNHCLNIPQPKCFSLFCTFPPLILLQMITFNFCFPLRNWRILAFYILWFQPKSTTIESVSDTEFLSRMGGEYFPSMWFCILLNISCVWSGRLDI